MTCDPKDHSKHMCALKLQGLEDCIKSFSDQPRVKCHYCGAVANSTKHVCVASYDFEEE